MLYHNFYLFIVQVNNHCESLHIVINVFHLFINKPHYELFLLLAASLFAEVHQNNGQNYLQFYLEIRSFDL